MREVRARRDISRRGQAVFQKIFGNLELRYTATGRLYSTFRGETETSRYAVLAKDADSVIVRYYQARGKRNTVNRLVFDGRYYWIALGRIREFFRRVR